jgi:FeS assembly protein SufD
MMDFATQANHLKQTLSQPPGREAEEWRYADFQFLKKNNYTLLTSEAENTVDYLSAERKVVFTMRSPNSAHWKIVAPIKGLEVRTQTQAPSWKYKNYFADLSEAFQWSRTEIVFNKDFDSQQLVEFVWNPRETMASGLQFVHKMVTVILEENACVYLLEKSFLNQKQLVNIEAQYLLRANAQLHMIKSEKGQIDGRGCHTSRFELDRDAQLVLGTASGGSEWSRHNVYAALTGENANAQFFSASIAQNKEFMDHHTWIDHLAPVTGSSQKYCFVLADEAHGVFNGRVYIHQDAQKSSAEQNNRNLLLSQKTRIDTKPELLIEADDVKAKHGATVGQLSADELFYLQSRGIDRDKARQMLTKGFVNDIADLLPERLQMLFRKEISAPTEMVMESK